MLGMLYKEFRLNMPALLIGLGVSLVMMTLFTVMLFVTDAEDAENVISMVLLIPETVMLVMASATGGASFGGDERKKWAYYTVSLPCGYKTAIGAKYVYNVMVLIIAKFLIELYTVIVGDAGILENSSASLMIYLIFLILFVQSIELPTIVRFGTTVSSYFRIGLILTATIAVCVWFLYFKPDGLDLSGVWEYVFDLMEGSESMIKAANIMNICCLAIIPLYYLSYRLSCRLYLKGVEEHYAK
ncbi:MAG: ABC-2 transporter permease [Ruminococcus sp.]|nr:ABC-2 transporter permease [Ruminococcus sp.]